MCSDGTVLSHDSSGNFEIDGLTTEAEVADLAMVGEEGSQETTQVKKPRAGRMTRKRSRNDSSEVNVMRDVDLNDRVAEEEEEEEESRVSDCFGLRGNVDLNSGPLETLGLDLNRAVTERKDGLDWNLNDGLGLVNVSIGYEEGSSVRRRGLSI